MISLTFIFIIAALGIAIVAEVLVAYQKYQMKREFIEKLDREGKDESPSQ